MKKIITIVFLLIIMVLALIGMYKYKTRNKNTDKILFLGDSLTARYDFKKYFPNYNIINSGIGGNLTTDILNDLDNRVFKYNPDKIFVLIGVNDIIYTDLTENEIKSNIEQIVDNIRNKIPNTKIYIESIYPVNYNINKDILKKTSNKKIKEVNKLLKNMCKTNKLTYINMYDSLKIYNDELFRYYTQDGVHLNKIGYRLITLKLLKYVNE